MKKEYDFSKMKEVKNPFPKMAKSYEGVKIKPIVLKYFKKMSKKVGLPYDQLINLYLLDCVRNKKKFF
jgi:hypothetical protein